LKKKYSPKEYRDHVEKISPKSKLLLNSTKAFVAGGIICIIGEVIVRSFINRGFSQEIASSVTTIILIFIGALLTGLNVYDDIGKIAGAGSIVPITGFANSIVAPAMEYKSEGYIMGVGAKMFTIAGPVIVYGIVTSAVSGVLYYLINNGVGIGG
jgi:stage V sporulation protein AC